MSFHNAPIGRNLHNCNDGSQDSSGPTPTLSIVIRARNEAQSLKLVFEALEAQRCSFSWEVIVVDNESEDSTLQICESFGARIISLSRDEFSYGRGLNIGIGQSTAEFVLILSAHALPVGSHFLESCIDPFSDPDVAAVRCLSTQDGAKLKNWYSPRDIRYESLEDQRAAESGRLWTKDYPAATCCVIRRSVWETIPFDEQLEAVEDKFWASKVLSKGSKIRCCGEAVYHRLDRPTKRDLRRKEGRELRELHRVSGYIPLTWAHFALSVGKSLILAPSAAVRSLAETLVKNLSLVLVPRRARSPRRRGSLARFDREH